MIDNIQKIYAEINPSEVELPNATVEVNETTKNYGRFTIYPLETGWGITLGNALRRTMLHALEGTAVTWIKVDKIQHEFTSIPHVKEETIELLMNIKGIRLRSNTNRAGMLRIEASGRGEVKAGDIMATGGEYEIVNPGHHLATLVSEEAKLSVQLHVETGTGFRVAQTGSEVSEDVDVMTVDAIFSPVRRATYKVEQSRYQLRSDIERLEIEVWTDQSISPEDALRGAAERLRDKCHTFITSAADGTTGAGQIESSVYNTTIQSLELSARTYNSLDRHGITRVGEVLELSRGQLREIRNFGEKSYDELFTKFRSMGIVDEDNNYKPPEKDDDDDAA